MQPQSFLKRVVLRAVYGCIALAAVACHAQSQEYYDNWTRHFRVGVLGGFNVSADFRTGGQLPVSGGNPGPVDVPGEDHFYDDGYVRVDNTGHPTDTSFWGYENASQYDADSATLLMHSTSAFSSGGGSASRDADASIGFDLAYGGHLWAWGPRARIGWELGFGLLPIEISGTQRLSGTATRSTYAFSTEGVEEFPDDPYEGGSSGIGPNIENVATLAGTEEVDGLLRGSESLDVTLYLLRLGPQLHWDLHPRWAVSVGAGPAVGLVSGEYRFNQRLEFADGTTARNRRSFGETELIYGAYVNGTVMYHAVPNGDIYLGVQYTPLSSATFRGGGRRATLDLSGALLISAGVNWPF